MQTQNTWNVLYECKFDIEYVSGNISVFIFDLIINVWIDLFELCSSLLCRRRKTIEHFRNCIDMNTCWIGTLNPNVQIGLDDFRHMFKYACVKYLVARQRDTRYTNIFIWLQICNTRSCRRVLEIELKWCGLWIVCMSVRSILRGQK